MPVHEGQTCIVRFVSDGKACAFMSKVVDWNSRREAGWVRLTWPDDVEVKSFRKHDRVKVNLPCTLSRDGVPLGDGEVKDMSLGGCSILAQVELRFGTRIEVTFLLPNGARIQDAGAIVRNARAAGERRWILGGEFCEEQEHIRNEIAAFVTSTLRPENANPEGSKSCVLILEGNVAAREGLKNLQAPATPAGAAGPAPTRESETAIFEGASPSL